MGKHQRTATGTMNRERAKMADADAKTDDVLDPIGSDDDTREPLPVERVVTGQRRVPERPLAERQTIGRKPLRDPQAAQRRQHTARRTSGRI